MKKFLLVYVLFILVLISSIVISIDKTTHNKISTKILSDAKHKNKIDVVIKFKDPLSLDSNAFEALNAYNKTQFAKQEVEKYRERILKRFDEEGIKIKNKFNLSNTITATISKEMLETLRDSRYVEWIQEEITLSSFLQQSTGIIQASDFWNIEMDNFPVNGTGETICIIDSGVDYRHDSLGDCNIVNHTLNGNTELFSNASDHPYANDQNQIFKINRTGFEKIAIHFDNITMEPEWDFLKILDPNNNNNTIAVYTGYHTDIWTPSVEGDTIFILLESDSSINTWGFEVDQVLNGSHDTTVNWSTCEKIIGGWDFAGATTTMDDQDPLDDASHGTHVAGIVSSTDSTYKGVAPGSKIVAMKSMNSAGKGNVTDALASIEYCVENKERYNISVILMSIGSGQYSGYCDHNSPLFELFSETVDYAITNGIMVVAASGNDAATGIAFPSCLENVTSVGATTKADAIDETYSNTASILDLLAPGTDIYSSKFNTDTEFYSKQGTSMAAPHVAGAALLLRNFKRLENGSILNPLEIRTILIETGDNITDSRTGLNFSRINLTKALTRIDDLPRIEFISGNNSVNLTVDYLFVNITTSEPSSNTTIEIDSINYSMQGTNKNYYYNITSIDIGEHNFSIYVRDSTNNSIVTILYNFSVDSNSPYYSEISVTPISNSTYSLLQRYQFNVTWNDEEMSTVFIEHNFTGSFVNYSVNENLTNIYFYNYSELGVGNYVWKMHAYDSVGNHNYTEWQNYSVRKANSTISLELNNSEHNLTWERGIPLFINSTLLNGEDNINLYFDNVLIDSSQNTVFNYTFQTLGLKTILAKYNDTQNYSMSNQTWFVNITDTIGPIITVLSPENNSIINQSYNVDFNFSTNENSTCVFYYNESVNVTGSRNFSTSISLYEIKYTNMSLNCTDLINKSTNLKLFFTINDTANPIVSSLTEASTASTITLNFNSNEPVNISATVGDGDVKDTTYTLTHEIEFSSLTSATNYNYDVNVCDKLGNCYLFSGDDTTESSSTSTNSGGGGGSSVVETLEDETDEVELVRFLYNPNKGEHVMTISKEEIAFSEVNFDLNKDFDKSISLEFRKKELPSSLDKPKGEIYQTIEVNKNNFDNYNLEEVEIYFEISKSWMSDNGFLTKEIVLARFDKEWEYLETKLDSDTAGKYLFKAKSSGFSYFSVLGIKEEIEEVNQDIQEIKEEQYELNVTEESPTEIIESELDVKKPLRYLILFLGICFMISSTMVYYVFRQ